MADFHQDPLIMNQTVGLLKVPEIALSDLLMGVAGYPLGTRPVSKVSQPIKV